MKYQTIMASCLLLLLCHCQKSQKKSEDKADVVAFEVGEKIEIFKPREFSGFVRQEQQIQVTSSVTGTLIKMHVAPGQFVRRGSRLASVMPAGVGFQAHEILSPAEGRVQNFADGVASGSHIDAAKPLITIGVGDRLEIDFYATESDLPLLVIGTPLFLMGKDGTPERDTKLILSARSEALDPRFGSLQASATFHCSPSSCPLPGSFLRFFAKADVQTGFSVPLSSTQLKSGKVLLISNKDSMVKERKVEIVPIEDDDTRMLVKTGVKKGDKIVLSASRSVQSKDVVNLVKVETSTTSQM